MTKELNNARVFRFTSIADACIFFSIVDDLAGSNGHAMLLGNEFIRVSSDFKRRTAIERASMRWVSHTPVTRSLLDEMQLMPSKEALAQLLFA